ncbi:MAG: arylsulfatase family protein [Phycisphaerales bacterium]|nr:arylsulfatase family protein [Phycisphaerales bacterium]
MNSPRRVIGVLLFWMMIVVGAQSQAAEPRRPNIIIILADDLGYGDVGCYGATKVKTPAIDKLAAQGLRFTDAHSTSATCTPSRYSLMTGEYAWRKKGTGILPGDAALIIDPARPTLPSILHKAGYATGAVGKWHLGLGTGKLNWNEEIKPGPMEIGFDSNFIIPATVDRVPCVFVENRRVLNADSSNPIEVNYAKKIGNEPTGAEHPELLTLKPSHGHDQTIVNGISRIGFMSGGQAARWKDEDIADVLTKRAVTFIENNKDKPFFLYFATHDVHVPRTPHARFVGTSQCGVRGDVIQEFDWSVSEIMATLDRLKLTDDTLVIVSSDNGPVVDDGYQDGAVADLNGHAPAGPWKGGKYTVYEGGTRMPFVARWPARIKPGGVSDALICQVDLLASLATLAGAEVPAGAGPDSQNVLPALLGEKMTGRETLVEQGGGVMLGMRKGNWKYIPRPVAKNSELYDLSSDPGETKNVAGDNAAVLKEMSNLMQAARSAN